MYVLEAEHRSHEASRRAAKHTYTVEARKLEWEARSAMLPLLKRSLMSSARPNLWEGPGIF